MKKGRHPKMTVILLSIALSITLSLAPPAAIAADYPELMPVIHDGDLYGYALTATGEIAIKPRFATALDFHEGLARVSSNTKFGFIDTAGKIALDFIYDHAFSFHEGLAQVRIGKSWGYIDKTGGFVVTPRYEDCSEFRDGIAQVKLGGKWGIIDTAGEYLITPRFSSPPDFTEGLARIIAGGKVGYIDKTGEIVISPRFDYARPFREGAAAVQIGGRWFLIDRTGQPLTGQFDDLDSPSGGLACFKSGDYYGFVDMAGSVVIPPLYEKAWSFRQNLAQVVIDGKSGFIDKTGTLVIPARFDALWDIGGFVDGLAEAAIDGKWGCIGLDGQWIIPPNPPVRAFCGNTIPRAALSSTTNPITTFPAKNSPIPSKTPQCPTAPQTTKDSTTKT